MANSSVIDQDIESAFGSSNPLYRSFNLGLISHIKLLRACTPSGSPNFAGNPFRSINSDIVKNDMRTLLCKEPRNLLSDARSGTRHKGDFLV